MRGNRSQKEFADELGVHVETVSRWERGKQVPNLNDLERIIDLNPSINPSWFAAGRGEIYIKGVTIDDQEPQSITIDTNGCTHIPQWQNPDHEMFDYIPMVKTTLSAGGGSFVLTEEIEGYYAFKNSWLNAVATSKRNLVLMLVSGDSMLPTIQGGDTVLIDTGKKRIEEGAIFALRVDDTVIIKRLAYRVGGKIVIISDNRNEFESYEVRPEDVHVLGQVIFFSRVLIPE